MSIQTEEIEPLLSIATAASQNVPDAQTRSVTTRNQGSTWYEASFLVINATLGAALLNFPQAYDRAGGIFAATLLMGVIVVFVIGALLILAHCSDQNGSVTYEDVVWGMCGKFARQFCALLITIYMFGACVTYLVVIGDQYDRAFASLYGSTFCHFWYMNRHFTLPLTAILIIFPMCFSKRIDFLKHPSTVGVISSLYIVFLVIYKYFHWSHPAPVIKTSGQKQLPPFVKNGDGPIARYGAFALGDREQQIRIPSDWTDIFLVVPTICFGFQCHISSIPVYSCLRDRTVSTFTYSVLLAMGFCIVAYGAVAICGYLTFGIGVPSDILMAYNADDPVVLVGIVMLAVKTIVAYPMLAFCGRTAIDGMWRIMKKLPYGIWDQSEPRRRMWISSVWFIVTLALAVFIPNIGMVIRPLGSLAAFMIFIYPGTCLMHHILQKDPHLYLLKDRLLLAMSILFQGVGAFVLGVVWTQEYTSAGTAEKILLCQ